MPVAGWLLTRFVLDQVLDEPGLVGAGVGAVVGAAGGNLAVAGPAGLLVAIVAGLVGAAIGYMAEKQMKDRDGIEYVLEMDEGRLVTLVQTASRTRGHCPVEPGCWSSSTASTRGSRRAQRSTTMPVAGAGSTPTAPARRQCQMQGQAPPIRAGGTLCSRAATWSSGWASPRRH
jgi:outer membrane lipoprotein SlyB